MVEDLRKTTVVEEIGGGLNYKRPKFLHLMEMIERREAANLIVAHKDRLVRFGFEYFEHFVSEHGGNLIIANQSSLSPSARTYTGLNGRDSLFFMSSLWSTQVQKGDRRKSFGTLP